MYKTGTNPRDHFTDKTNTWSCDLTKADLRAEDFKFSHKYMLLSHCDFIIITNLIFLFKKWGNYNCRLEAGVANGKFS